MLSGRIKVNSRRIYLCETQDSNQSTSYGSNDTSTASSAASDNSESGRDTSTASLAASDNSESGNDTDMDSPAAYVPSESDIKAFMARARLHPPNKGLSIRKYDSYGDSIF